MWSRYDVEVFANRFGNFKHRYRVFGWYTGNLSHETTLLNLVNTYYHLLRPQLELRRVTVPCGFCVNDLLFLSHLRGNHILSSEIAAVDVMASQALIKAVTSARITQTQLLLQLGVDVNSQDSGGRTVLMHALSVQEPKVRTAFLLLLLKAGAAVSLTDDKKRNALMLACRLTHQHDVNLLLRHADVDLALNAVDGEGRTALWAAVDSGKVGVVKVLLRALSKHELNTEVADHWGVTPAMRAATLGHLDCLGVLLGHLDTMAKSNNTLINVTRINAILKDAAVSGDYARQMFADQHDLQRNDGTERHPTLPVIRVITALTSEKTRHPEASKQRERRNHCPDKNAALFSLEFLREPTRCSTPTSEAVGKKLAAIDRRPSQTRSGQISPIAHDHDDPSRPYFLPPLIEGSGENCGGDQDSSLALRKRSCHTHTLSTSQDDQNRQGTPAILAPVEKVKVVSGSVRDSLPALFEISAQQASDSFRKAAVKPRPPSVKKITPAGEVFVLFLPPPPPLSLSLSWCVRTCMYVRVRICVYVWLTLFCVFFWLCVRVCVCVCVRARACVCIYIYMCVCVCVCVSCCCILFVCRCCTYIPFRWYGVD